MPSVRLRGLQLKDLADAARLAADFHNASAYRDHPLDLAKVDAIVDAALVRADHFNVVLADASDDRMHGYLLAVCHEHYFSRVKTVTDLGFYIDPPYRSWRNARAMVLQLETWAFGSKGAVDISLGVSSGIADEATVRFYRRLGYDRGYTGVIKQRSR